MEDDDSQGYSDDDNGDMDAKKGSKRKRVRASKACDQCRKRRTKCSGSEPTCISCLALGIECNYSPSERRRGPTAFANEITQIKQRLHQLEAQVAAMSQGTPANHATQPSTPTVVNNIIKNEPKSPHPAATESLYVAHASQFVRYFGSTSSGASNLFPLLPTFNKGVLKWASIPPTPAPSTHPQPSAELVQYLIDVHFKHVHPVFPCINVKDFETQSKEKRRSSTFSFLLECIMGHAVNNISSLAAFGISDVAAFQAACFTRARGYLFENLDKSNLHICQGLLFIALVGIISPERANAWVYSGMAMRVALELGLHRNTERHQVRFSFDDATAKSMVDTFFCCYVVDRYSSLSSGRPIALPDRDWDTPFPQATEGLRLLKSQAELCVLIGEVCSAGNAVRSSQSERALELENIKQKLTHWYDENGSAIPGTPTEIGLVATYHCLCILDHRFSIGRFDATTRASSECIVQVVSKFKPAPLNEQEYDPVFPLLPYLVMIAVGSLVSDALNGDLSALVPLRKVQEIFLRLSRVSSSAERLLSVVGVILMQKGITIPGGWPIPSMPSNASSQPQQVLPPQLPLNTMNTIQGWAAANAPLPMGGQQQQEFDAFYGDSILDDLFMPLYGMNPQGAE
ncbi:hypothetical protein SmJEL517_g04888 [Synchytrium microbalum]|uniref:Zn(2)-C6 fungal-type domain-containing protein n=1 Tax=Synchytrium microbalum TaxID=1806994 RepID=A0A507C2Y3_9FUNG|nr:uncharacterized protein SmJEL517_g04888 [Synchytrium microbalum]TPX31873.1 hypothetical protein SmJEL517_g04888 [Synchytrium microbalum]